MRLDPTKEDGEVRRQAENTLLVELCRYFAQILFAARNGLDSLNRIWPMVELPQSGIIPAQAILLDGAVKPYRYAGATLVECGFATEHEDRGKRYILDVSSEDFALGAGPDLQSRLGSYTDEAFLQIFKIYEVNEFLGHPDTLRRILSLSLKVGITEIRHGYVEWSQPALELAKRRRLINSRTGKSEGLWAVDTFDLYIKEAEAQWLQSNKA